MLLSRLAPTVLLVEDFDRRVVDAATGRLVKRTVRGHPEQRCEDCSGQLEVHAHRKWWAI